LYNCTGQEEELHCSLKTKQPGAYSGHVQPLHTTFLNRFLTTFSESARLKHLVSKGHDQAAAAAAAAAAHL
jgi:hypothetical protein